MKERNLYFDFLKGLAILGVITIHMVGNRLDDFGLFIVRNLACSAVFVFFVLSGYFINREKFVANRWEYVYARVSRLWITYLFWTAVVVSMFSPGDILHPLKFVGEDILLGLGVGIGYYIVALTQLLLLLPIIVRLIEKYPKLTLVMCAVTNLLSIAFATYLCAGKKTLFGYNTPVPMPFVFCGCWVWAFALGVYMKITKSKYRPNHSWRWLLPIFGFVLGECWLWQGYAERVSLAQFRISVIIFNTVLSVLILSAQKMTFSKSSGIIRFIAVLGSASFLIYLTHMAGGFRVMRLIETQIFGGTIEKMSFLVYALKLAFLSGFYYAIIISLRKILPQKVCRIIGV